MRQSGEKELQLNHPSSLGRSGLAIGFLLLLTLALSIPAIPDSRYLVHVLTLAGINIIFAISLNVVMGFAGQPSIGHGALLGAAAYISALLTLRLGLAWPVALAITVTVTACLGFVLGLASFRFAHMYLAIVTLGFAILFHEIIMNWTSVTNGNIGLSAIPEIKLLSISLNTPGRMYNLVLAFVLVAYWISRNIRFSGLGRALLALRGNEHVAASQGINPTHFKRMAFVLSSMIAAVAGSLYAHFIGYLSPDTFDLWLSVQVLVMNLIGGLGTLLGPLVGALALSAIDFFIIGIDKYHLLIYGSILLFSMFVIPDGIVGLAFRLIRRWRMGRQRQETPDSEGSRSAVDLPVGSLEFLAANCRTKGGDGPILMATGIEKHFQGLRALDGVDLTVRRGSIHGLIGPNGSGKTTLINTVCGLYPINGGEIRFENSVISGQPAYNMARYGIARTFQNLGLIKDISVLENVMIGQHNWRFSGTFNSVFHLPASIRENRQALELSMELLQAVGLAKLANQTIGNLPLGHQRFVEVARAIASRPKLLFLDEPASCLTAEDTERLAQLIRIVRACGVTVVLVEHNVNFVVSLCDHLTVLEGGRRIASGDPLEVIRDERVIKAYLGEDVSAEPKDPSPIGKDVALCSPLKKLTSITEKSMR